MHVVEVVPEMVAEEHGKDDFQSEFGFGCPTIRREGIFVDEGHDLLCDFLTHVVYKLELEAVNREVGCEPWWVPVERMRFPCQNLLAETANAIRQYVVVYNVSEFQRKGSM